MIGAWSREASRRGGPLQGIRVVELTKVWAGPFTGKLLGFLGAEVIRVESMSALDTTRSYNVSDLDNAPGFQAVNTQKLSVQIDMKSAEGRALLLRLLAEADVLIENMRPGATRRLGLAYEDVVKVRSDIVYVAMGMHGDDGPLAYQTGYAPCFAALGGLTKLVGYEGGAPVGMNIRYGDSTVGAWAALGAMAALVHRRHTGEGQFVDVSAVEAMSAMVGDTIVDYTLNGSVARCDGNRHADMAPHGVYPCTDGGWIGIAAQDDAAWRALAAAIEPAGSADDPRFATLAGRLADAAALDALIGAWTAPQDAAALAGRLRALGIAAEKIWNSIDLVTDSLLWEDGFYQDVTDCLGAQRSVIGPSWKMSGGAVLTRGSPALGQDNDYVLGDILGLSSDERVALAEAGITR